ncbi:MAG TPA: tyrosinase family protein [Acidobacteriaceae bacterium]|nr:tyrosinase family protein [Acidobacteriaceae bacterium]
MRIKPKACSTNLLNRREFVAGASALAAFSMAFWTGGCEACLKEIENRPTRRNIAELSPSDPIVTTYQSAVAAMKALHSTNPISWEAQANIHYNKCPHGCWFFLPWHRAYLLYFERICRKLTGNSSFALPYWNWTTSPSIPAVFWGGASNPLYDATRLIGPTDTADPSWVGASTIEGILGTPSFTIFASDKPPGGLPTHTGSGYGELESIPHNNIHGWVGGDMGAFHSPLDPIFWMHHNMLDCLWVDWNINLGNANTSDTSWTNYTINDFVDENGNPVSVQVIDTVLYPLFLYQFEPCAPQEAGQQPPMKGDQLRNFLRAGAPSVLTFGPPHATTEALSVPVGKPVKTTIPLEKGAFDNVLGADKRNRLVLTLEGVEIPPPSEFFLRVFLDKEDASADTSTDDPHFAGSFGIFSDPSAMGGMQGEHSSRFLVDITDTAQRLNRGGALPIDHMDFTLVAVAYKHRTSQDQQAPRDQHEPRGQRKSRDQHESQDQHEQVVKVQRMVLATARLEQPARS